jgi:spermidine synthase
VKDRRVLLIVSILFFGSGASALIYQILWLRLIGLVFGVTVYAASTVWASFMAGLALGSFIAGRFADHVRRPLAWFGATEILIGITALATPAVLKGLQHAYTSAYSSFPLSFPAITAIRFAMALTALIVPTALMGMTLPLVVKSSASRIAVVGEHIGVLYGTNTAGAIAGTLAAGLYLIPRFGIHGTFVTAAAINFVVGALAIALSAARFETGGDRRISSMPEEPVLRPVAFATPTQRRLVLAVFTLSGFTSLALEVIWFRVLTLFMQPTVYSFAVMLATLLAGIAIGSWIISSRVDRAAPWVGLLAALEMAIGIVSVLSFRPLVGLLTVEKLLYPLVRHIVPPYAVYPLAGAVLAVLPTAILLGIAFPIGVRLWTVRAPSSGDEVAERIGVFYSMNVAASIVGSLAGGFVLLPLFGSRTSLLIVGALSFGMGLLLLAASELSTRARMVAAGVGFCTFCLVSFRPPEAFEQFVIQRYPGQRIVWHEEGVQATVLVHQARNDAERMLTINGAHQAATNAGTLRAHRMIGALPMAVHPNPRRALVIGLGGGVTAGAVSLYDGVHVDVVELSEAVVRGAQFFSDVNEGVLSRPNVNVRIDDGRNFLMLTSSRYDVVTADIIQPIIAGSGNLYSEEYFRLIRGVLNPGGVVLQWVMADSDAAYRLTTRTFLRAFPHATAWAGGGLLIGTVEPLELRRRDFESKLLRPNFAHAMRALNVTTFDDLLKMYTAGPDALRAFVGNGPILTDDRPLIEYFLSLPRGSPPDLSALRRLGGGVLEVVKE